MSWLAADLHVHTALSPCASDDMTPPAIVSAALEQGLDMIAICDHNSAGNTAAVRAAAEGTALCVLAGIEITTSEEAHLLGIFHDPALAQAVAAEVCLGLPRTGGRVFGRQLLMDAGGAVVGEERLALSAASGLALDEAAALVRSRGGLVVAAHLDRPSFSVLSQLGLWPSDVRFDAVEVSTAGLAAGRDAGIGRFGLPVLAGSDAHSAGEIGACFTKLSADRPCFEDLCAALGRGLRRELARA